MTTIVRGTSCARKSIEPLPMAISSQSLRQLRNVAIHWSECVLSGFPTLAPLVRREPLRVCDGARIVGWAFSFLS